jgi:3'(2'), 5'-bisphosphate nucleotidase
MTDRSDWLEGVAGIARRAGQAILDVYERDDFQVQNKQDDSPLTAADMAAHRIIVEGLEALTPGIPVLSEESGEITWAQRRQWDPYWLVDPLDGTKEFINRNGEFTVNIALIEHHRPVLGVVHVPVKAMTYLGLEGVGAFRETDGKREPIAARPLGSKVVMVASRRHGAEKVDAMVADIEKVIGPVSKTSMGSSLKLCLVAEGSADIYPRLAPTSEWDTGAAHAVVNAAGGVVVDLAFNELGYNREEDILNPHFLVLGNEVEKWRDVLS